VVASAGGTNATIERYCAISDVDGVGAEDLADRLQRVRWMDTRSTPRRGLRETFLAPGAARFLITLEILTASRRQSLSREHTMESLERVFCIGDHSKCERPRHAHVARIDIDLDELGVRRIAPVFVIRNVEVAEPGTRDQDNVGLAPRHVRGGAVCIEKVRMIERQRRAPRHRAEHRTIEQLHDFQ
jgi:hypothetical protein